jgi:hypothetical protein
MLTTESLLKLNVNILTEAKFNKYIKLFVLCYAYKEN